MYSHTVFISFFQKDAKRSSFFLTEPCGLYDGAPHFVKILFSCAILLNVNCVLRLQEAERNGEDVRAETDLMNMQEELQTALRTFADFPPKSSHTVVYEKRHILTV